MVLKSIARASITLFIIGFIGVTCGPEEDQKKAVFCLKNYFTNLPAYKLLTNVSPETFLTIYARIFPSTAFDALYVKQDESIIYNEEAKETTKDEDPAQDIRNCLRQESIFTYFAQKSDEEIQTNKSFTNPKTGRKYEFTNFGRFAIGLLKSTGYLFKVERTEMDARIEASICLSYYVRKLDNYKSYDDNAREILNAYCKNPSLLRFEEDYKKDKSGAYDEISRCLYNSLDLYEKYKNKALEKVNALQNQENEEGTPRRESNLYSDYSLFAYEICDTEDWENFETIKDEVQRFLGLMCLIDKAEFFINEAEEEVMKMAAKFPTLDLKSFDYSIDFGNRFKQACGKKETLAVEGVTVEGVKILKEFDVVYLEVLLHNWRKHIQKETTLDDSSRVEQEEKNLTEQNEHISLKNTFEGLIDSYLIQAKWSCLMKERNDIPFLDWIQNDALVGKPAETLTRYLEKFKNDIIDKQISLEKLYEKIEAEIKADSQINLAS